MSNYKNSDVEELAGAFKALSNPWRLRLFLELAGRCCGAACCTPADTSCCVGELAPQVDVAPSTVSHHLKELRLAGLVQVERDGQFLRCSVDPGAVARLKAFFATCAGHGARGDDDVERHTR